MGTRCFVEQKNGSIVRQLVGDDRFEGEAAYRQLGDLYRAMRLYVNFFRPSMKLLTKRREGGAVQRSYAPAKTPFRRPLEAGVLGAETKQRLEALAQALDPVRLLRQVQRLQDALWRHAVFRTPEPIALPAEGRTRPFVVAANEEEDPDPAPAPRPRKYRRTEKSTGPRWWRTRADPFAPVWEEIVAWLDADPTRTGASLFAELEERHPGQFAAGQCRTLQRRVQEWRAQRILVFAAQWLQDDVRITQRLPRPLRTVYTDPTAEPALVQL